MNMDIVINILDKVAVAKGKQKETVIGNHIENPLLMKVFDYALNPMVTFGIGQKTVEAVEKNDLIGDGDFSEVTWKMLDDLAQRKITGGHAESTLGICRAMLKESHWSIVRRILLKDLRGGFTADTINRVKPKSIPVFKVMLAHKYEAKRIKQFPVNVEIKHDGVRVTTIVNTLSGDVQTLSRTGKEFKTFDHVKADLLAACRKVFPKPITVIFDGEMISGEFNKTVGDIHRKNYQATDAVYHIFDMLSEEEFFEQCKAQQLQRRKRLENFFKLSDAMNSFSSMALMTSVEVHSDEEIQTLFNDYFAQGFEGVIVKIPTLPYVNKRNHGFMKLKNESSEDLIIVDLEEGEKGKKYEGLLGALVVDFKGVRVSVSSGLSDVQRTQFWHNKEEVIGRIIEVEYHEVTPDGSLRHPRFKRFRDTLAKGCKE